MSSGTQRPDDSTPEVSAAHGPELTPHIPPVSAEPNPLARDDHSGLPRPLAWMHVFFSSWRFPILMLAVLAAFDLFQLAMLLVPASMPGIGAFAEEFRVWCYGLNQETGRLEKSYVAIFLLQPAVMCGVLGFVWWKQVRAALRYERRAMLPYLAVAAVLVAGVLVSLVGVGRKDSVRVEPFPAQALRTKKPAPALALVDQHGERVELAALKGNVVVVTGIYATCFHTCPLIMAQLKRSLDALRPEERASVRVLGVTLNPEHDDQAVMLKTAARYQVKAPEVRLLSGTPDEVNQSLDRLEIARSKNPMSGEIDHANLFILVDKQGDVAYRLTLGERQERWLVDALRLLVKEPRA
ncbi:MAG: SCO family protein [Polyangiaceae bacterium]